MTVENLMTDPVKPQRPPDPPGLTAPEIKYCRSVASGRTPQDAFKVAWPDMVAVLQDDQLGEQLLQVMTSSEVQDGIEFYRADMADGAPKRLQWDKAIIAEENHLRSIRLGLNKTELLPIIDRGTPELRAKLKSDVIIKMRAANIINEAQLWAAREIAAISEARERGLFSGGRWYDGTKVDNSNVPQEPSDALSEAEQEAYVLRYLPWLIEVGSRFIHSKGRRISIAQLVRDIVVNNYGPRQIDTDYGMRHGSASEYLRDALWSYAVIAGWVKPKKD